VAFPHGCTLGNLGSARPPRWATTFVAASRLRSAVFARGRDIIYQIMSAWLNIAKVPDEQVSRIRASPRSTVGLCHTRRWSKRGGGTAGVEKIQCRNGSMTIIGRLSGWCRLVRLRGGRGVIDGRDDRCSVGAKPVAE